MGLNIHNTEFVKSAAAPSDFIRDSLPKVAFAGKSNVGKSSVINRLLNRKNFARVGAAPGKTVHVNYFRIDGGLWFADLPGYGYAKVSKTEKDRWGALMEAFFAEKDGFGLGVLLVDARHAPTGDDVLMADWFLRSERPFVVAANKCDKVKKSELEQNIARIRERLALPGHVPVVRFSAETGFGRDALWAEINRHI